MGVGTETPLVEKVPVELDQENEKLRGKRPRTVLDKNWAQRLLYQLCVQE